MIPLVPGYARTFFPLRSSFYAGMSFLIEGSYTFRGSLSFIALNMSALTSRKASSSPAGMPSQKT